MLFLIALFLIQFPSRLRQKPSATYLNRKQPNALSSDPAICLGVCNFVALSFMPLFTVFLHCIIRCFFSTSAFDSLDTSMCTSSGQRLVTRMYVRIKSTIGYQSCPLSSNGVRLVTIATIASYVASICLTNYICFCFTSDDSFLFLFSPSTLANSYQTLFCRHVYFH